jgi:plastocyanin
MTPTPAITVTSQAGGGVRIIEFSFNPSSMTVAAGNTVTWTNAGTTSHTTTADSGAWNSGPLRPGASFSQTFNTPGTFSYHCMIHPTMMGTVTVTSSGGVSVSPAAAAAPSASVSYSAGWNLVAGPAGTTIAGTSGPLYTLRGGDTSYETVASGAPLSAGAGYWAYFNATTTMSVPATGTQSMSVQLPAGQFVMVGDPGGTPVTVTGADTVLTYDAANGYQPVTKLNPGQGAWAFSANGGTLAMSPA